MATEFGSLVIGLGADTATLESDMGRAAHITEKNMERMIARATAAGELIGDALGKGINRLANMAQEAIHTGDELVKLSQKTAFSVERLSELSFGAKLADVSLGSLSTALSMFEKTMSDAHDETSKAGRLFTALGVDIKQGPQAAFEQFAKAINQLPDGETKAAAMRVAFGRTGDSLIPLIKSLDETSAQAHRLGVVMSEDLAQKAAQLDETFKTLKASSSALTLEILTPMAGALVTMSQNFLMAKESGNTFKTMLIEISKVIAATMSIIPGYGAMADKVFQEALRMQEGGGVAPRMTGDDQGNPLPAGPSVDAAAVQRALNRQPRADRAGRATKDPEIERLRKLGLLILRNDQELEHERAEYRKFYSAEQVKDAEEVAAEKIRIEVDGFRSIEVQEANYLERGRVNRENYQAKLKEIAEENRRIEGIARDLGNSFSSMFEGALAGGKSLSSLFKALENDLLRMGTRLLVTEPLMKKMTELIKGTSLPRMTGDDNGNPLPGGGFGELFKGGMDWVKNLFPSFAVGTPYVQHDMLAMVHQGETIIPAGQSGGTVVHMNITTPDAGSFRASRNQIAGEMQAALSASRRNR